MIDDGTLAAATSLLVSTHGESGDPEAPMDAILALADSAVDAMEIVTWPLGNCEVVTLSACYGGQFAVHGRDGRELPGDEMFGIPAAFIQAGAKIVLAPEWPVDARIAAPILIGFHRRVAAGLAPDLALQQAQCEYLDDPASWPEAYFWAGFTLVSLGTATAERA
jgi:CHAT domain-containing protein